MLSLDMQGAAKLLYTMLCNAGLAWIDLGKVSIN